ncbi:hypothetical protein RRG08_060830 [Elysia crispata]|uniref:Uncharacterized protein n=1 Tax=Elysia crispata TaxID=231223 RepID=A0AAE0ZFP3_9GAST|nr:hypothetical protein RRG08_060830 [Elysia crispata]
MRFIELMENLHRGHRKKQLEKSDQGVRNRRRKKTNRQDGGRDLF